MSQADVQAINQLIDNGTTPGHSAYRTPTVAAAVVGKGGEILYKHTNGVGHKPGDLVRSDTVFWLASIGKIFATVAVLQTVEKGLIGLDDDVEPILPDLTALEVLDGKKDGNGIPTTQPRKNKITLRRLLSHQAGVGYDIMPPAVEEWAKAVGLKDTVLHTDLKAITQTPLASEPGTEWVYGAGSDWASILVSRLHKTTFEEYLKENIWAPLGMTRTTLYPRRFIDSLVQLHARDEETGVIMAQPHPLPLDPPAEVIGHGLWGTLDDFVKFLQALLDGGGPILSQKSVDLLFLPEIFNAQSLEHAIQEDYKHLFGAYIPRGARIDHSIGGLLNLNDLPGRRRGGTLQVTGMPNTIWFIDRKTGIAAVSLQQFLPNGDPGPVEITTKLEEAIYKAFGPN